MLTILNRKQRIRNNLRRNLIKEGIQWLSGGMALLTEVNALKEGCAWIIPRTARILRYLGWNRLVVE